MNSRNVADSMLPYAQLGLRLLGIMFIVDGITGLAGAFTNGTLQAAAYRQAGYDDSLDAYAYGWAAQSVVFLVIGVYFVCGRRAVLRLVFQAPAHTGRRSSVDTTSDIERSGGEPSRSG